MNKMKTLLCLEMLEARIRANVAPQRQSLLTAVVDEIRKEVEKHVEEPGSDGGAGGGMHEE